TFVFTALRRFIDYYKGYLAPFLPFSVVWLDYLLLGILLILIQMYRPEGIVREKPTSTLSPKRLREITAPERMGPSSEKEGQKD
ncbi:MAG: hypothetical protein OEZ24_07255, partial [Candidatus Bathyarchaeota archaeon]|nr:hypothetical protein [Candidatus Bathyarchaeota archaeon]